jgi:hypothetical protein
MPQYRARFRTLRPAWPYGRVYGTLQFVAINLSNEVLGASTSFNFNIGRLVYRRMPTMTVQTENVYYNGYIGTRISSKNRRCQAEIL